MKRILIGLTGLARAGKSTVAEHLRDEHGFQIVNFADALKAAVRRMDPIIGAECELDVHHEATPYPVYLSDLINDDGVWADGVDEHWVKENYPEYRRIMQTFGTDAIRTIDDGFWINQWDETVDRILYHSDNPRIVVSDCRFPNEALAIRDHNSIITDIINVYRPGHHGDGGTHASEAHAGHLGENTCIVNDAGLDELRATVDAYLKAVLA